MLAAREVFGHSVHCVPSVHAVHSVHRLWSQRRRCEST